MRRIGALEDEKQARALSDYLLSQGYDNQVDHESDGWAIWVYDDDHLDAATDEFKAFRRDPSDARFRGKSREAGAIRRQRKKDEATRRALYRDVRTSWSYAPPAQRVLTLIFVVVSVVISGVSMLADPNERIKEWLFFSPPSAQLRAMQTPPITEQQYAAMTLSEKLRWNPYLKEIREGQVWRIVTPIFVHLGFLHLLFNMFWLHDLGSIIETGKGSFFLLVLIMLTAIISNIAQFFIELPWFGGMSGVIYGLFGYIWMKGKFQPEQRMRLHPNTVIIMLVWMVLCMTGIVGNIANTAHVVGLVVGVVVGYLPYWWKQVTQRRGAA